MKTLRKTAEEAYLKHVSKIINREAWIDGFISGIQYKKEYPQSIELCGLLWDTENLAIGGYEKNGRYYYTWQEAMDAVRSAGKRLPTKAELKALCDLGSTWDDERKGRWFGGNHDSDHKGSLFLPAAGMRHPMRPIFYVNSSGYYWSSTLNPDLDVANSLCFTLDSVFPLNIYKDFNFSVRCVQDK